MTHCTTNTLRGTDLNLYATSRWLLAILAVLLPAMLQASPIITVHLDGFDPSPYAVFGRSVIDPATNSRVTSNAMDGGRFAMTMIDDGDWEGQFVTGDAFYTFCIEPREFVTIGGTYSYELVSLEQGTSNIGGMGVEKADKLRELFGRFYSDFSQPITTLQAGALQIAIWEIVREDSGTLNVYSGDIYFFTNPNENPAGVVALAHSFVSAIDGTGPKASGLVALYSAGGVQDLIGQTSVPEPATFALTGFGLLGFAMIMKRTRRQID